MQALKRRNSIIYKTWMNLEEIMLSEIKQLPEDKYVMVSLVWNLKILTSQEWNVECCLPEDGAEK